MRSPFPASCLLVSLTCGSIGLTGSDFQPDELTLATFEPGTISTSAIEDDIAFLPDGGVLFSRRGGRWGGPAERSTILEWRRGSTAAPVAFSGIWSDGDPFVSPDGSTVVFVSDRPTPDGRRGNRDLWTVRRHGGGWGEPQHLPAPINSDALEMGPSLAADGTLYFSSNREGGEGHGDLYRAPRRDGRYAHVENLGRPVNGPSGEWNVLVEPNARFIIFESSGRPGSLGPGGDLYLSYRAGDGWRAPIHLDAVSTPGSDLMPRLDRRAERLYFATTFTGDGVQADIVSVSLGALLGRYPPQGANTQERVSARSCRPSTLVR